MANYNLVVNSKFQPFSLERYLKPYQMYGEAYNKAEEQYASYADKASLLDGLIRQDEKVAREQYDNYMRDLKAQSDRLATEGLIAGDRKNLLNLRSRFGSEIAPIQNAYNTRLKEIEKQSQGKSKGIVYERDASTVSLDELLANPTLQINGADSAQGYQRVLVAADALSKKLSNYGRSNKRLDGFTRLWLQEHGYTDTQVHQAISDLNEALRGGDNLRGKGILQDIVANEMDVSGVSGWSNKAAQLDYFNRINSALYKAVGQTSIGTYEDKAALIAAQEESQRRVARYTRELNNPERKKIAINPSSLFVSSKKKGIGSAIAEFNANSTLFNRYFKKDTNGNWSLTKDGWEAYHEEGLPKYDPKHMYQKPQKGPSIFKEFLDSIGAKGNISSTGFGENQARAIGNLWGRYLDEGSRGNFINAEDYADSKKYTEFKYEIKPEQRKSVKGKILEALSSANEDNAKLKEISFNKDAKVFSEDGSTLSVEDLASDNYEILSTRMSPYGESIMVQDNKGNVKRYELPSGINEPVQTNIKNSMNLAHTMQDNISTGMYFDGKENRKMTEYQKQEAQDAYEQALQDAYMYMSQLFIDNKTESQDFGIYSW